MKALTFLFWFGGLCLVFLAANIFDPYLLPVYGWAPGGLFMLGFAGFLTLWRICPSRLLLRLVWLAVPLAVAVSCGIYEFRKFRVLSNLSPLVRDLGRHFVVGYRHYDEIKPLAAKGLIGGIYVTRRNIAGRRLLDLKSEIASLQAIRSRNGLAPLFVATDQEGGAVDHLSPPLSDMLGLSEIAALPKRERRKAALNQGRRQGRELAALGVNLNFAPVLDLRHSLPKNPFDFHSHIAKRAISGDPDVVASVAGAYAEGLAREGVGSTVKHFPGLGRVKDDTHHFRAELATPEDVLERSDWKPFRKMLAHGGNMVMISHVTLSAIDPDYPTSQSRKLVDGILRRQWGFQGLAVSDDLTMSAVYQHGFCQGVLNTLNAGVDLLLIAYDDRQFFKAMDCMVQNKDLLDAGMLAASDKRLNIERLFYTRPIRH